MSLPTSATSPNLRFYMLLGRLLLPSSRQRKQEAASDEYADKFLYDFRCYIPQVSCHFLSLSSKYLPPHPILKHPRDWWYSLTARQTPVPIQNNRQNYCSVYFNLNVFIQQKRRQNILEHTAAGISHIKSACYDMLNIVYTMNVEERHHLHPLLL